MDNRTRAQEWQRLDLTAYGVQPRYPMEPVLEERDMYQALDSAKMIRDFVLNLAPPQMAQDEQE